MSQLHIGCGKSYLSGFINVDTAVHGKLDLICDARHLAFSDESFDLVYACHVLEHFPFRSLPEVLREWRRVIQPGGYLRLSVPDFNQLVNIYQQTKNIEVILGPLMGTGPQRSHLYGGNENTTDFHFACFDQSLLENYLKDAGFVAVHTWDFRRVCHGDVWDYSQAETYGRVISLNLEARKPLEP